MENNVDRSKHDALNKLDGVAEGLLERIRRSRALEGGVLIATGHADSSSKQQGGPNANEPMADANIVGASMDASDTNSLTNATKQAAGPKVNTSFASVIKSNQNKVVQITELRNEEHVEGAAVTIPLSAIEEAIHFNGDSFLFQFKTKEDSDIHKEKIKKVPVWVELHHVFAMLLSSEVGLRLNTTQIGKPIRLDAYTSNMCLQSWGRSAYARALIEVLAEDAPKEELVIAIPLGKDKGHSLATIRIEYEWTPLRCSTCLIFDHTEEKCPKRPKEVTMTVVTNVEVNHSKDVADDGFEVVKKKRNKKNKHKKQVDGVVLNKPSITLHYRRVDKGNSTKQSGSYIANTSKEDGKSAATSTQSKNVRLENSFSTLNDDEDNEWKDNTT
ncbi:probable methyltransferase PMT28 isoform X1 [Tanacetum coccineum]|uniref:Probable methyltransferase PMT28 isoform X1 n=1 Tax=Tanacetum coccineum TaxID=301880 RepID=A0ABQ4Z9G7_9ASTR